MSKFSKRTVGPQVSLIIVDEVVHFTCIFHKLSQLGYREEESSNASVVCIGLEIWRDVCQKVMIGNMADITERILSLHKNSPITSRLERSLPKSKYITSNQYSSTERRHFALNADSYTHFTSPIRRYFDIVVHRVLFSETTEPLYDDYEMEVRKTNV